MRAHETQGAGERRDDDRRKARRAARRGEHGPIGFSQVFAIARKGAAARRAGHGAGGAILDAAARRSARGAGGHLTDASGVAPRERTEGGASLDALSAGQVPTALVLDRIVVQRVADGADPLAAAGGSAATDGRPQVTADAQATPLLMTPQQAFAATIDEARHMNAQADARELVIQLEPEHLGPLLVRITVERGRVRAELNARDGDAVRLLGSGSEELRRRLERLGYASAEVVVEQRSASYFLEEAGLA